jgi:hypothetical protein
MLTGYIKMNTSIFQYKCRLCHEIYDDGITSEKNAQIILISTVLNFEMPHPLIGQQPKLIGLHSACKKGYGVGDLIGYINKETD